jgi:hypothetical protein
MKFNIYFIFLINVLANGCFSMEYESKEEEIYGALHVHKKSIINDSDSEQIKSHIPFTAKQTARHRSLTSVESMEPELVGNRKVAYASPFLEKYTQFQVVFWNTTEPIFDMLKLTSNIAYSLFATVMVADVSQSEFLRLFVVEAMQCLILQLTFCELSDLAKKIIPIVEKNVLFQAQINARNRTEDSLFKLSNQANLRENGQTLKLTQPLDQIMEDGELKTDQIEVENPISSDFNRNDHDIKSDFLENFYSNLACAQNVIWYNCGFYTIMFRSISASSLIWSIVYPEHNPDLVFIAALFAFASGSTQLCAKFLSKNTLLTEQKQLFFRAANRASQFDNLPV